MWRLYIPMELRARTMELPTRTMELRTRTMELRTRTMEFRTRTMELRTRTMELRARTMELRARTMELRARMSEICRDATRRSTVVELHRYPAKTGTLPSHRHPPVAPALPVRQLVHFRAKVCVISSPVASLLQNSCRDKGLSRLSTMPWQPFMI
jgi:hypothetical protein